MVVWSLFQWYYFYRSNLKCFKISKFSAFLGFKFMVITETVVDAFSKGILPDGELYKDLTKFNHSTMEDVLDHAWTEMRWEEDKLHYIRLSSSYDSRSEDGYPK